MSDDLSKYGSALNSSIADANSKVQLADGILSISNQASSANLALLARAGSETRERRGLTPTPEGQAAKSQYEQSRGNSSENIGLMWMKINDLQEASKKEGFK
ncbi:unnamed protein product [Clonostachys solani]|uniref:Uncharacterized protein n=1 Tax=Clonostachys solani TaxID=160281 RepID=A0A9N9W7Y2_9HYPO|nr:unnamed protein product [Clonostachys solani]